MEQPNDLRVRQFGPADYPMVVDWGNRHRNTRELAERGWRMPPLEMLPQVSVIVYQLEPLEDLCAIWLYMAKDCPVCLADHVVTRPGLRLARAKAAVLEGLGYLKFFAARQGYLVMNIYVGKAMARVGERAGWFRGSEELVQLSAATFEIPVISEIAQEEVT